MGLNDCATDMNTNRAMRFQNDFRFARKPGEDYRRISCGVFKKFSGRLLSADESPDVQEGGWDRDKVVLMSFPDEAAYRAWAGSPEYQEISKDRKAGATAIVLLVKGFGS